MARYDSTRTRNTAYRRRRINAVAQPIPAGGQRPERRTGSWTHARTVLAGRIRYALTTSRFAAGRRARRPGGRGAALGVARPGLPALLHPGQRARKAVFAARACDARSDMMTAVGGQALGPKTKLRCGRALAELSFSKRVSVRRAVFIPFPLPPFVRDARRTGSAWPRVPCPGNRP